MAKKKTAKVAKASRSAKKSKAAKRAVKKSSAKRAASSSSAKRVAKKKPAVKKKRVAQKRTAPKAPTSTKKTPAAQALPQRKRAALKRPAALGRPRVPGTADLDQMFLKDYEARQVFAFLGVKTIKELEEHPAEEIVERLTAPLVQTVARIRKALAVNNRYLAGDQKFAVQFCKQIR